MSRHFVAAALAVGVLVTVPLSGVAGDLTQLQRAAGIRAADADAKSLDEIAAIKFSRDSRGDPQVFVKRASASDMQAVHSSRAAGASSLDERHLNLVNASVSENERQIVVQRAVVDPDRRAWGRLAVSAGLPGADGMSPDSVAAYKFNREVPQGDRTRIRE